MKGLLLFAALTMAATEMKAQQKADSTASKSERSKVTFAPEIGAYATSLQYTTTFGNALTTKSKFTPRVAAMFVFPISETFFIQTGLAYFQSGIKKTGSTNVGSTTYPYSENVKINNMQLPLSLGYKFGVGKGDFFLTAGPYADYLFDGSSTSDYEGGNIASQKTVYKFGPASNHANIMKRINYGFNGSLGYELPMGLYCRGQFDYGFTKLTNATENSTKILGGSFSIGYKFHFKNRNLKNDFERINNVL